MRHSGSPLIALTLLLSDASPRADSQASGTRADGVRTGPHAVGFDVRSGIDASRRINSTDGGTRVGLAIWYPAGPSTAAPMTTLDYRLLDTFNTPDARERLARADELVASLLGWRHVGIVELTDAQARASLATHGLAVRGAPPADGRFPVVVVPGGQYYLSTTAEILATHGFIVVAPFRFVDQSNEIGTSGFTWYLENSVRDAEWALRELRDHPHADLTRVGVLGHGGGGMQAMLLTMRSRQIGALVNLDASNFSARSGAQASPFYAPRLLRTPYLYIATPSTRATQDKFEDFLAMRFSERVEVVLDAPGLRHHDLSDLGRAVTAPMEIRGEPQAGVQQAYADMHEMTVRFLREHLGGAATPHEPLSPWLLAHQAKGRFTATVHAGGEPAPTTVRVLETLGPDTPRLLSAARARDPEGSIFEPDSLGRVIEKALRLNDLTLAAAVADLAVGWHPAAPGLLELSSRTREALGDAAGALDRATACATVNPGNDWRASGAVARCRARVARLRPGSHAIESFR